MHEHDYVKDLRCPFIVDVQLCSCYDTKKIGITGKALVQWVVEKPEGAPLPLEGQEKTWQKPIANYQGVNGYVEVLASYENGPPLGNTRFHVCYANPCTAMYDSKGKFGKKGPSYHGFYCGAQHVDPMFCPFDLEVPKTPSEAPPPLPETPGEAPLSPHETPGEATPKLSTAHVPASPPTPDPLLSPTFPAPLPDDEEDLPTEPAEAESLPIGMIGDRLLYATATPLDVEEEPATYATEKIESEDSEEDAAPLTAPAVPAPPLAVPALPPDASVGAVAVPPPIPPPPELAPLRPPSSVAAVVDLVGDIDPAAMAARALPPPPAPAPAEVAATRPRHAIDVLLERARQIRKAREYTGYETVLVFCLKHNVNLHVWTGENRVNFLGHYAPWALSSETTHAAIDLIACCHKFNEHTQMPQSYHISEQRNLLSMNHWVGGIRLGVIADTVSGPQDDDDGDDMAGFYFRRGISLLPLDATGDCLLDQLCVILGHERTLGSRLALRIELADCMCDYVEDVRFLRSMAALREVTDMEADLAITELEQGGGHLQLALNAFRGDATISTVTMDEPPEISSDAIEALRWALNLGSAETAQVGQIALRLPAWALAEKIRLWDRCGRQIATAPKSEEQRLVLAKTAEERLPTRLSELTKQNVRLRVGKAFHTWIVREQASRGRGGGKDLDVGKLKYGACARFAASLGIFRGLKRAKTTGILRRCLAQYRKDGGRYAGNSGRAARPKHSRRKVISDHKRRRRRGGGRHVKCPIVRQHLFDWWSDMRLSIDYRKVGPRFPQKLIVAKWNAMLADYAAACLTEGTPCDIPQQVTAEMMEVFEEEFNLSLRKPNRRFKVARHVLAERLEIFWINLFRVRKLCLLCWGYDPEMQNFDQSPFHRNEAGRPLDPINETEFINQFIHLT